MLLSLSRLSRHIVVVSSIAIVIRNILPMIALHKQPRCRLAIIIAIIVMLILIDLTLRSKRNKRWVVIRS